MSAAIDERVQAIRDDQRVGEGSCSHVDECWEDHEIVEALDEQGVRTPEAAIKWAMDFEELMMEKALNQASGEESDGIEALVAEWRERLHGESD